MKQQTIKIFQSILTLVLLVTAFSCQKNMNNNTANAKPGGGDDISPKDFKNFVQVDIVGTTPAAGRNADANLVNGWGITFPPSGPAWVSSEGKGKSTIYNLDGVTVASAVNIPYAGTSTSGHPTGHVYNPTSDFKLPDGNPAQFIFATADGTISGWNSGNAAVKKIDRSPSASYLGIAMANVGSEFFLYVANFAQNRIDVYDKNWNPVVKPFADPTIPSDYAPFNIQTVSDGKLYVTYAKKNAAGTAVAGPGNGYINVFNPEGVLLTRFASKGKLDAPWGITKAPAGFWGEWSQIPNLILVANNGDGHINVFDESGNFLAPVSTKGKAIEIDGLWGITFPPITGLNRYYMYFAAGPNDGSSGLVGYVKNGYLN